VVAQDVHGNEDTHASSNGPEGSASAAEVVKVRVGNHPTYTRVVFQLDASTGYRIEEHQTDAGSEIRVTLDASSSPFNVDHKTVMVEKVALDASTGQSVARIQLHKTPSRVREMILANPPRIVFDLVFPESQLAAIRRRAEQKKAAAKPASEKPVVTQPRTAATTPPTGKPAPSTAKPAPQAKKIEPPPSTAQPQAKKIEPPPPAPIAKQPEPPSVPTATRTGPKTEPFPAKPAVEKQTTPAPTKATSKPSTPKPAASQPAAAVPKPPSDTEKLDAGKTAKRPSPPAARPGASKVTQPKRAATPAPAAPQPGGGFDLVLWGSVAAGTLIVLVVAALLMRRRSLPNDGDVTAVAEDHAADGAIPEGGFSMQESPAEAPFEAPPTAERFPDVAPAATTEVESKPAEPRIAAGPGLFDDEDPEKENESMDLENSGMEQTASEMPTQLGGGATSAGAGDAEVSRLVRELERRMAQMETRLDETTEARERLERQVAAQAEELRVQRAAIARTQRALRSLNRPAEEQATEPAIREPSA
jgi:hypothetical protein